MVDAADRRLLRVVLPRHRRLNGRACPRAGQTRRAGRGGRSSRLHGGSRRRSPVVAGHESWSSRPRRPARTRTGRLVRVESTCSGPCVGRRFQAFTGLLPPQTHRALGERPTASDRISRHVSARRSRSRTTSRGSASSRAPISTWSRFAALSTARSGSVTSPARSSSTPVPRERCSRRRSRCRISTTRAREIRSPQNPYDEEASAVRIMNAVRTHARLHGNTKPPVFSPWNVLLADGNAAQFVENRQVPPPGSSVG